MQHREKRNAQSNLDWNVLLADSPLWSPSLPPDWELGASEELQDTEWLMGWMETWPLEARLSSRGRNMDESGRHDPENTHALS